MDGYRGALGNALRIHLPDHVRSVVKAEAARQSALQGRPIHQKNVVAELVTRWAKERTAEARAAKATLRRDHRKKEA